MKNRNSCEQYRTEMEIFMNQETTKTDMVNHPPHYTTHPSGVECIQVTEHMGFCLGNAMKYIWRADLKTDALEDLEKAQWYLGREISKRRAEATAKAR